ANRRGKVRGMIATDEIRTETGPLARPAGPLSSLTLELLALSPRNLALARWRAPAAAASLMAEVDDPLCDDDLQLALYLCDQLHYRGFTGVDPAWEWSPLLLALRTVLEEAFLTALRSELPPEGAVDPGRVGERLLQLEAEDDGTSLSRHLDGKGDLGQFREF